MQSYSGWQLDIDTGWDYTGETLSPLPPDVYYKPIWVSLHVLYVQLHPGMKHNNVQLQNGIYIYVYPTPYYLYNVTPDIRGLREPDKNQFTD